jgi:S-adenosyl-L-methionine hydrolase (adenosine-forming)
MNLCTIYAIISSITAFFLCVMLYQKSQKKRASFILMTDFGYDFAVGCIKGVIKQQLPDADIIDLDHTIEKFSIISAAFVLEKSYRFFPKGSIFICVVDPGVGTSREPLCIKTKEYVFIGPNNGVFETIIQQEPTCQVYEISTHYLQGQPGNTFHGRDLFAPAAVDCYTGNWRYVTPFDRSKLIALSTPDRCIAVYIDSFGNVKTNRSVDDISSIATLVITIRGTTYEVPFVRTFQEVAPGELLCYRGSNDTLEIAVRQDSGARALQLRVGDYIDIRALV